MNTTLMLARDRLALISEALTWSLLKVLNHFPLREYEQAQIAPYLAEWGHCSLHEFLLHIGGIKEGRPDLTGSAGPTNIFLVLADIYGY